MNVSRPEADGLRCVARGSVGPNAPRGGFYHPPMLFADVPPHHPLVQEEILGPVLVAGGGVELPFDGFGRSGHGREKGLAGLLGFTTLKTVAIKHN